MRHHNRFNVTFGVVAVLAGLVGVGCAEGMFPGDSDCENCRAYSKGGHYDGGHGHTGGSHSGGGEEEGVAGCPPDEGSGGSAGSAGSGGSAGSAGSAGSGGTAGSGGSAGSAGSGGSAGSSGGTGGSTGGDGRSQADAAPAALSLFGDQALAVGDSHAWYPGNTGPNSGAVPGNADILGAVIDIGDFLLLTSRTEATSAVDCNARAGTLGENLSFAPGADPSKPLVIDLLQVGGPTLPVGIADTLHIEVGAFAAETDFTNGELSNRYRIADVDLVVGSPAVATAAQTLYQGFGAIDQTVEGLVNSLLGSSGFLAGLVSGISGLPVPTINVDSRIQEKIFADLLTQSVTSANEVITINLATGQVEVHLDELVEGGINNQPPNTEIIDAGTYSKLATPIQEMMSDVASASLGSIDGALDAVEITLAWQGAVVGGIGGTFDIVWTFTLQDLADGTMPAPVNNSTGLAAAPAALLTALLGTSTGAISGALAPLYDLLLADGAFDDIVETVVGNFGGSVANVLQPVFGLAAQVVSVQVNHQTWETCTNVDSEEVPYHNTISALSVGLLQAADAARVDLGWASCEVTLPQCD